MALKIKHKLFLALVATIVVVLLPTVLLTRLSFERGFLDYVNALEAQRFSRVATELGTGYEDAGDWAFLQGNPRLWRRYLEAGSRRPPGRGRPPPPSPRTGKRGEPRPPGGEKRGPRPPPREGRRFQSTVVPPGALPQARGAELLDAQRQRVAGRGTEQGDVIELPVTAYGETVGFLRLDALRAVTTELDVAFARQQSRSVYLIAIIAVGLAGVGALWLARHLVAPIGALAAGTRDLAAGDYEQRIAVASRDEIGQLANDFNQLAAALDRSRGERRAFFADISHELRTPLTILRGEIDAMLDGVRKIDAAALESLSAEVARLNKLVDDVYQLALSDAGALTYRHTPLHPDALIADVSAAFAGRFETAGLTLRVPLDARGVTADARVSGDRDRLAQLIGNLLENSLRYTAAGGEVCVASAIEVDDYIVTVDDSAPSPNVDDLAQLFEPLFREERSRSRVTGGAGLGLSIASQIVDAHGGTIEASHSTLGGLRVRVVLPAIAPT